MYASEGNTRASPSLCQKTNACLTHLSPRQRPPEARAQPRRLVSHFQTWKERGIARLGVWQLLALWACMTAALQSYSRTRGKIWDDLQRELGPNEGGCHATGNSEPWIAPLISARLGRAETRWLCEKSAKAK
ncbi:hypothetical protein BDV12DRAFT_168544 [Aspergillus spectabilis]